jgi:hypothetical protein
MMPTLSALWSFTAMSVCIRALHSRSRSRLQKMVANARCCCRLKSIRARSAAIDESLRPMRFRSVKSTPFATPAFQYADLDKGIKD